MLRIVRWTTWVLVVLAAGGSVPTFANPKPAGGPESSSDFTGIPVSWWRSSEDLGDRLSPQPGLRLEPIVGSLREAIRVDAAVRYQSVLGLGSSLEHSTCYNLGLLPSDHRERVIESLVHPERGLNSRYLSRPGAHVTTTAAELGKDRQMKIDFAIIERAVRG
jgi:glucosylceramidase